MKLAKCYVGRPCPWMPWTTILIWTITIFMDGPCSCLKCFCWVSSLLKCSECDLVMDDYHGRTRLNLDPINYYYYWKIWHYLPFIYFTFSPIILRQIIRKIHVHCRKFLDTLGVVFSVFWENLRITHALHGLLTNIYNNLNYNIA